MTLRDDDVGAGVETGDDPPRADVGICGQCRPEAELVGASEQVVAFDMGDVGVDAEGGGELTDAAPPGRPG